ncbi:MAG TPA: periplasmic heavy metal sensor [Casimicrobiaceae bacterium]|jgi:protein CpxP|nr:periplasmic heavy metal sensor [Casimicrobiaceae bacterium]
MKRKLFALIFAAGFIGLALTAWAQAPGHGMHDPLAVLQRIQAQLNLNTSQQQQWDAAVAQSKATHQAMRANFQQLKTATQAELAKADPDLAALATLSDQVQQQNIAQRKQARAAWLALYATFSADQKTTVKDAINAKIARMEAFRQQRMQNQAPGSE